MIYFSTSPFVAWILLFAYVAAVAEAAVPAFTYKAVIKMIPGMPSNVTGTAIVFSIDGESTLGYAGMIDGLNPSSIDACTIAGAPDGCGVHLHSGFTCENAMQGENYFAPPVSKDPWTGERYGYVTTATTNSTTPTSASFAGIVDVGSASQLSGRAFVVHAENGTRIACGLLQSVRATDLLATETQGSTFAYVAANVTVFPVLDTPCYFGKATNLEIDILAVSNGGSDCQALNGCGTHIHIGSDCFNQSTQGGHLYNAAKVPTDPWLTAPGYRTTDHSGTGYFAGCVETGASSFASRAFVLHANDGSRVSCGTLSAADPYVTAVTSPAPTTAAPRSSGTSMSPITTVVAAPNTMTPSSGHSPATTTVPPVTSSVPAFVTTPPFTSPPVAVAVPTDVPGAGSTTVSPTIATASTAATNASTMMMMVPTVALLVTLVTAW